MIAKPLCLRVRTVSRSLLASAAFLGLTLPLAAQTSQAPAEPPSLPAAVPESIAPPSVPAPTPGTAPAAIPAAQPASPDSLQTTPGYAQPSSAPAQKPSAPAALPVPQKASPPVVTSVSPDLQTPYTAMPAYGTPARARKPGDSNSGTYIPVDSWVYPAMLKLYSMGYLDTMYVSLRPYTRRSALHMLQASEDAILSSNDTEAQELLSSLMNELSEEGITEGAKRGTVYGLHSVYTRLQGISGSILQDSFHLGQTYFNDYGRPHGSGFNNVTGFSTLNERGRFSLYLRGEYQHAPAGTGYSQALGTQLSLLDEIYPYAAPNYPQATIPPPTIAAQNPFRLVEGSLSFHVLGHEISGGKSDAWLSPAVGGAMTWSNNAENIYSFRINRVEPLKIKYISRLLGPVRYDFFYGSLKGHTAPNNDWVHSEMFSFRPTRDFEFGFQRTIVFGGKGHEPVTLHTFLKGFFDTNDTAEGEKKSRNDPGARFSAFNFSYRLPFARRYLTLYTDSEAHDDVTPISAPRRAAYRPGIFLSQFPGIPKLDLRVEAASTDCSTLVCQGGSHQYIEDAVQRQAYTNKGYIFGDWIGREAKGGQAWLTYHLSGNESVQLSYLNKKTPKDFIPGGTTQNQFTVAVVKRIGPAVEINSWYMHEGWKAPIYKPGGQSNNTFTAQVTFFPKLKTLP